MIDFREYAMNIVLEDYELRQCREFSERCSYNQQQVEFGQHDTIPREKNEISRDNYIGKIAEKAFQKMLIENYKIDIELDFNYYPRGKWDNQDALINDWRIDVKATRQGGKWLLVEWNKIDFRKKQNLVSDIYLMCIVDWDRNIDAPTGGVDIVGVISNEKLTTHKDQKKIKVLRKGEYIPGTKTRLQADNYGIHKDDLFNNWDEFIDHITTHKPYRIKHSA